MPANLVGAPAQHSQPSRKGKKAWRKHVDINDVETVLESLRDEERTSGNQLHKKTDDQLFQIDVTGDANLKRSLPKYDRSLLMSSKILAQRSAIPPVLSRASSGSPNRSRAKISHAEKGRLLRIAKRKVKGPFNALVDLKEFGSGSAILELTEAVKKSGKYDVWSRPAEQVSLDDKGKYKDPEDFLLPLVTNPKVKAPEDRPAHPLIELPAVAHPHQGTSYNPPVNSHQELLLAAHEVEQRREHKAAKFAQAKERIESARHTVMDDAEQGAPGMSIDNRDDIVEDENDVENTFVPTSKVPVRKTQKKRRRAAQLLGEKRALLERRRRRRFLASVTAAKSLRVQLMSSLRTRQAAVEARRKLRAERFRQRGFIGQKIGKHRVDEGNLDVQLGEELSESLRGLKPQGNLFRDRFLSLQYRALVEPRVLVFPKRRVTKIKEYEKHAWKRFE